MKIPRPQIQSNTADYETVPLVKPTGFREYDARWILGEEINLLGIQALGLGLATYIHEIGQKPRIVVGHDFRSYSLSVKQALTLGLLEGGMEVLDIGLALSPCAYFAQFALEAPCVAMVTASHNENGWTGVKMGAQPPLTFGPDEVGRLKAIVLGGEGVARPGGALTRVDDFRERYIDEVSSGVRLTRPIRVVAACGNGTAGAFAPEALRRMGADVIEMDVDLDWTFPKYNPNPEDHAMLSAMAAKVRETGADLALGFDGDGDRCGVVDDSGEEIYADKIGLLLGRDLSALHPDATFVVDVKSTGLYKTDEVLKANGAKTVYWKTGHSYIKRKTAELGALAGFEKSGHFFFNAPLGRGYDDGLVAAGAVLAMLDRNPGRKLSELKAALPAAWTSMTMSPHCDDELKYGVLDKVVAEYQALADAGGSILGRRVVEVLTVNGARVHLDDGSWVLVRASSNKPELVVVVESMRSEHDMRALFREEVKPRLARHPQVGAYNQEV
ncbi:MAG: phosphomannomutase/phosphoglucomutase [Alphaproteobacteria bacterium]|nr:phosphomannomutase/phosphoglucomutase [Alphaproteobacteria bacterium]MBU1525491.1 phosphomannomutase/phosphoglucomutase [Alphaproteobacteria bacterium]MBU2115977.1 phosphomannomutase/phosphoglucomutase [Alphaproteobacteria bacterium]MBU2350893.1 phosphomannomutase/phosphoglucomutase [Alphaproteobacteria bacterium]MBU2381726.1 phosphomannomutase/phosphoglucomutase [Alphaproteobacteria bacterium]